jgi:hypothetical protein
MANEYTDIVAGEQSDELRQSLYTTGKSDPNTEAKLQTLAGRAGLPVDAVRQNKEAVELNDRLNNFDYQKVIKESPKLSNWIAKPNNAGVAYDDVKPLSGIERMITNDSTRYLKASAIAGFHSLLGSAATVVDTINPFSLSEQDAAELFKDRPDQIPNYRNITQAFAQRQTQAATDVMANLPDSTKQQYDSLEYLTTDLGNAAYLSPTKVIGDVLNSLPSTAALAVTAYLTRGAGLRAEANALAAGETQAVARQIGIKAASETMAKVGAASEGAVGYGQQYNATRSDVMGMDLNSSPEYQQLIKDGYSPEAARTYMAASIASESGLLAGTADAVTNFFGGQYLGRIIAEGGGVLSRIGKGFLTEGVTESVQSALEQVGQNVATRRADPNITIGSGVGEAAAQGLVVGGVTGGAVSGALGGNRQVQLQQKFFEDLQKGVNESELFKRMPARFQEYVKELTIDGPIQNVFIDAQTVLEYYQSIEENPAEAMAKAGVTNFAEALETGGDVVIPMDAFMAQIVPTDALQVLMPDIRLGQGDATIREMEAQEQVSPETISQEVDNIAKAAQENVQLDSAIQEIINDVSGQLQNRFDPQTSNQMATVMRGIAVLANRANPDADPVTAARELWNKYGLNINARAGEETSTDGVEYAQDNDTIGREEMLKRLYRMAEETYDENTSPEDAMSEMMATATPEQQAVLRAIEKDGLLGFDYPHQAIGELINNPEAYEISPATKGILSRYGNKFYQSKADEKRGSIQISPDRKVTINLFEKADLSTVLHEVGHLYLEVLGDLATAENTSQQVKDDFAGILKWMGVNSREDIQVKQHEMFARANELYLMEGKAPSPELRGVFQRFKAWLMFIYKTARNLNVQLNDDVREVFDRIYATDAEIETAKRQDNFKSLFTDAASAGLTEAEFNTYAETVARQTENAKDKLRNETMRVERLKRESWWKEERSKVAAVVGAEYDAMPAAIAFDTLTQAGGLKLSSTELTDRYGADVKKQIRRGYGEGRGAVYSDEGSDIDSAAEVLGYPSGDNLIEALIALPPRARFIATESESRMINQHGDILNDVSIADAAQEALHNTQREQVLKTEIRALRKLINPVRSLMREQAATERRAANAATQLPPVEAFRAMANGIIGQKSIKYIQPNAYLMAERKANRLAFEAMAKKDYLEASAQKQRELLNHYLYKAATTARKESDKIYDHMRGLQKDSKRQKLGLAGADYLEQIDAILEQYEFKPVSNTDINRRKSLRDWAADQTEKGDAVAIPESVMDDALQINYRELPMDQLRAVYDTVRNIEHLANLKNKIIRKREQINFNDVVSELIQSAESSDLKSLGELDQINQVGSSIFEKGAKAWRRFDASLIKIEQLIEWLDGGKINGPWARYVFDMVDDAQTREYDLHKDITKRLQDITEGMPKGWLTSITDRTSATLPGIRKNLSRYDLISIALNTGNETNLQRLRDGRQWSQEQIDTALSNLTATDWKFVQDVWDTLETLWPELSALEKRQSGLEPPKVEARSFLAAGMEMRGGYFPLVYDKNLSEVGEKQAENTESITQFFSRGFGRPATDRGATKARVDNFSAPLKLDFEEVLSSHVAKVIKDISHREAVLGVNKILMNPSVKETMIDKLGESRYREFKNWLQVIVNDRADTIHQAKGISSLVMHARTNTAIVTMGYKISTMLSQFAGLGPAMDMVKPRYLTTALVEFTKHPRKTLDMVLEKSGEMRHYARCVSHSLRMRLSVQRNQ